MRLARTAAPLPRVARFANRSGRQESNLRSPAPEAGGVADSPTARRTIETLCSSTPGGTRTRSFRVEGPASSPVRPRGREAPAAGLEPAVSRVTTARLSNSTTPERKERESNPQDPKGPPVFETGYRAVGSPSKGGARRRRTCTDPGKNRELCRLSYGAAAM
jgi:hypothetical protein